MRYVLAFSAMLVIGLGVVLVRSGQLGISPSNLVTSTDPLGLPVTGSPDREDALIAAEVAKTAPALRGGDWANSEPLKLDQLNGRVVLVEFWTFDCYNCRNTLPTIKAFDEKYRKDGLTVIGVHTPELDQEREWPNVTHAVKQLGITYPVVSDNAFETWNAYNVAAWPTVFILDKKGRIRFRHTGEGAYGIEEQVIKKLLAE
ncbi:MAG: redoxin domain-containing protein [Pyrinomonadaceae bacterium]